MVTALTLLIALNCFLLMAVVLIQNPKGGGVDSTFGGQVLTKCLVLQDQQISLKS